VQVDRKDCGNGGVENGQLQTQGEYVQGVREGCWQGWHANGQLWTRVNMYVTSRTDYGNGGMKWSIGRKKRICARRRIAYNGKY